MQNKIQSWVDSGYYNGASIIIVKDDQTIYKNYFGPYKPGTVVFIASAGKWLAAATIAAVVDAGKLNWNDPVRKWLPGFVSKLRVYTISDQDDSGPWIRKTFPTLFYIVSPG